MDNPFELQVKRVRDATRTAVEFSSNKESEKAKNAWSNVITLLTDLKNSVDNKRKELEVIKEKLQEIESKPSEANQNVGNTNYEKAPLKPQQQKEGPENKASLSYDLDLLIKRLYKGKLTHNEEKYQESIKKRADHLSKGFLSGKLLSSFRTMPKLNDKKSYGEILSEFSQKSTLIANLKQKEAEEEANSELYRTLKQIRKKQKEKQERSFVGSVAKFVGGMIVGAITDKIKDVVNKTTTVVKAKMAVSQTGRNILNRTTKVSSDLHEISTNVNSEINPTIDFLKKGIKTTTKIFKVGYDVLGTTGKVVKSIGNSAIPAVAVFALSGSGPLAAAYLAGSTTLKTITLMLDDTNLSSIRGIRNLQINHGRGMFKTHTGSLKVDSLMPGTETPLFAKELVGLDADLLKNRLIDLDLNGRIDTTFGRTIRIMDAVSTWAPVGALAASLLGISPILGGILAASGALGIQAIKDSILGGKLAYQALKGLPTSTAFRVLAELPFGEFMNQYQTNMWVAQQLDLIKNRYRGDFGAYFKDNWNPFDNANIFKTALVASNVFGLGGAAAFSFTTPAISSFVLKYSTKLLPKLGIKIIGGGMSARALGAANAIGTIAGVATAILLGIPIGPAMILGSVIGSTVGLIAGTVISLVAGSLSFGAGFLLTAGISYVTTLVGSWIGSLFDKAIGLSGAAMMNLLQGMMALFQMVSLLTQKFEFSNFVPIALGLITLMATLYKSGVLDTSNECLGDSCQSDTTASSDLNNNLKIIELSSFNIKLLIPANTTINSDTLSNITDYLSNQETVLNSTFAGKDIVINLASNESYSDEQIIILGIGDQDLNSIESISTAIDNSIKNYQGTMSVNDKPLGNEYTFLNISK